MSTNFFGIHLPTLNDWERRKKKSLEEASDMAGLISIVDDYYEARKPRLIHIGKRSGGWVFLFAYNGGDYYQDKASLQQYLKQCQIEDENGNIYFFEEFWKDVVEANQDKKSHIEEVRKNHRDWLNGYRMIDTLEFLDGEFC